MSKSLPEKESPAATVFTLSYSLSTMIIRVMCSVKDVIALTEPSLLSRGTRRLPGPPANVRE